MKAVLMSIQPKYCELIASGKKTIEVRKSAPKLQTPFKCYIYCTQGKPLIFGGNKSFITDVFGLTKKYKNATQKANLKKWNGKVIGEFVCDRVEMVNAQCSDYGIDLFYADCSKYACLNVDEVNRYFGVKRDLRDMKGNGYGWHISDLKIYDKPKELGEFSKPRGTIIRAFESQFIKSPPQSWCYVEEEE